MREDDGQFCDLFARNLENVQGDERDLVILSVCYGYTPQSKMRMNLGPTNKAGREKRLNVVFSRARHHMLLVSSVRHSDIRNDYHPGAFVLKAYLQYAEHASAGDQIAARQVIELLGGKRRPREAEAGRHAVVQQIGAALAAQGFELDFEVGQSGLCCDLGVRRRGDARYRLGNLVDTEGHYQVGDVVERYLQHPALMRGAGWALERVTGKDWVERREEVLGGGLGRG